MTLILLSLLAAGCGKSDAKLRLQINGAWSVLPSGSMVFYADGSFHFTNSYVSNNTMLKWASDGMWDVKDGFLIMTVTNSMAVNTDEKPLPGQTSRRKINFVDEHNLACGDQEHGASYHR